MVLQFQTNFLGNPFKTREDVERACCGLLDALEPHTSPGGAEIFLSSTATHYDLHAVALEAFARPLWGLTSLLLGGGKYEGTERWIKGFANGTDPISEEYWGKAKAKDQRMVEMSPLSFAISMAPDIFYNNQTPEAKKNIAEFLESCIGKPMPDTNWLWFRVFANLALRTISSPSYDPEQMSKDLARLDSFQLPSHPPVGEDKVGSGGWSRDGPEGVEQLDYYSGSFAIQFAQVVYAKLAEKEDPERAEKYKKRARDFVKDFIYYFDEDGNGVPFGRSMVYRFAIISTFSILALGDIEPLPITWGHLKGLVLRHFRSWSQDSDIFRSDGTLTIGYKYDNMNMTENYNAPGSPYWCMKAFACLAVPSNHPFWSSEELPYPTINSSLPSPSSLSNALSLPSIKALPDPGHIMVKSGGHTFLLSSGQYAHYYLRHASAKYSKFSYSSTFGFSCPTGDLGLEQLSADNMIALRDVSSGTEKGDGETWRVRRIPIEPRIIDRGKPSVHLRSKWRPWGDVEVETWLFPPKVESGNWYIRIHKITSSKNRNLEVSEAGWSTYGQGKDGRALIQAFSGETSEGGDEEINWARAATKGGCVGVLNISLSSESGSGSEGKRIGKLVQTDPNSNVIFSRSILPSLSSTVEGETAWLATGIFGAPPNVDWRKEWENKPSLPPSELYLQ